MATRAATFTAKIRNLKDYHYRMVNNMSPQPSGVDIANTLKYFSQTLLSVLKDVPIIPQENFGPRTRDSVRLSVFPNLNYSGVYDAVMNIIEVVPLVQYGQHALGEAILNVFGCLVPFLEYDLLDTLPYTVASTLAIFSPTLQKDTIQLLCTNLLPVTLGYSGMNDNPTYATDSCAAIILMVFQYVGNGEYHSQLLECIMSMKKNVLKDLLSVIAYGPPSAKAPAVNHLFHYWPQMNPALTDRRGIHYKYQAWQPVTCQREDCSSDGDAEAVKVCLDPAVAIQCGEQPPPLYLCAECVLSLRQEHTQYLIDILRPIEKVAILCENKNCMAARNQTVSMCFSLECASFNGNKPIRYCLTCHQLRHGEGPGVHHIYHMTVGDVWSCEAELQGYLVEAIVSLLKEAQPMEEKRGVEMGEERSRQHFEEDEGSDAGENDERKLLSRYGIWLMVELCKPKEDVPIEILGRLLAMLFQWFDATAYLPDDHVGNALERLKPEYVYKWLQAISQSHFEVILSCLLPHPVEYARVGGYWDTLASRTSQIKEGLNRLFCLVPYDIVTYEVWDYVIPFWLEAIRTEVSVEERPDLKVLLCKIFDTEMCPLPFDVRSMYHFLMERFMGTPAAVQEQNLAWLQILSSLDIIVPLPNLLEMFQTGVRTLATLARLPKPPRAPTPQPPQSLPLDDFPAQGSPLTSDQAAMFVFGLDQPTAPPEKDEDFTNIGCFIMMLDLCIKQIDLQEAELHAGVQSETCKGLMLLLTLMLNTPWEMSHVCDNEETVNDCRSCEVAALWHQLAVQIMEFIAPKDELKIPDKDLPKVEELQFRTLSEQKTGGAGGRDKPEEKGISEEKECEVDIEEHFDLENLPVHLRLLHSFLKTLDTECDADALYFLLKSTKLLCLHAECLSSNNAENDRFIKFCLKHLMIPNVWKLLQAEHSQIACMCVPIMLHCLTLNSGADILWGLVSEDFNNEDWRARFSAVEKATMFARLINPESVRNNQVILTALSHMFCFLIGCLGDVNSAIVQRTGIYLDTIKDSAIKCICQCLEFQFDSVINDRTLILARLEALQVVLKDRKILTWEFFLNRFDTLCLEAQLDLEGGHQGDNACFTDLTSSDRQSEHFLKKINRARFALARTNSIRSVSGSIFDKPPYRRAASVPLHLVAKNAGTAPKVKRRKTKLQRSQMARANSSHKASPDSSGAEDVNTLRPFLETYIHQEKDKAYTRQQSAPQFGRRDPRGSRIGTNVFSNYMFSGGNLREFTDEESNFAALLQRAMDLEGVDRETVHQLVTLLMRYMVYSDQDSVSEDRNMCRAQNIVLRHLNVLLGYNQTEKAFSVPPYKLRYSPVFSAYLAGLSKVLDKNFTLGNIILPVSILLLQYSPSPQRYASDYQPANYTLYYLEPHCRLSWLQAMLVILYKYQYNISLASGTIHTLIRIIINTVEAQIHQCKRHDDTFGPHSPVVHRNRDTSNVSIGDLENIQETDTPPQSPTDSQPSVQGDSVTIKMPPETPVKVHYKKRTETEKAEDTDVDSSSPASKVTSPVAKQVAAKGNKHPSPPLSPSHEHSSPQLSSPDSRQSSPSKSPAKHRPGLQSPPRVGSPTEELARIGRDQPRRIAEYSGGSPPEVRDAPSPPANKKRTLEQSVEEYMRQQFGLQAKDDELAMGGSPVSSAATTPTHTPPGSSVDQKMAEQLRAFTLQNESPHKTGKLDDDSLPSSPALQLSGQDSSDVEFDSPRRQRMPLSKSHSAGAATESQGGRKGELTRRHTEQAINEKSPSIMEESLTVKIDGQAESELDESPCPSPTLTPTPRIRPNFRQRKARKTGLTTVELQKKIPELSDMNGGQKGNTPRKSRKAEMLNRSQPSVFQKKSQSALRYTNQLQVDRCPDCNAVLEQYDEDTISMCIVALGTFIHREPSLAAPLLVDTLQSVARIASSSPYPWQAEISGLIIPGNSVSVARQFIRCVLHQLAPNGIFAQLFMTNLDDPDFLKTVASALVDFVELNCYTALQYVLEGTNEMKNVTNDQMLSVVHNLSTFMDYIALETNAASWQNILMQFDLFFRRLPTLLPNPCDMSPVLKIMIAVLKIPGLTSIKTILDPFSKILGFTIENCTFKLQQLLDICSLCSRAFTKERDKLFLSRCIIFELVQALKFKAPLPDENLIKLVQFVVMDAGGTLGPTNIVEELASFTFNPLTQSLISTNAAECMKQHLHECVEFIADLHTINRVKSNVKDDSQNLNEDTLGSHLKAGIAQFIALEFTRGNGRDNRAIARYLPWLYHPPSAMQQGPKEFLDCVGHMRLLSWLLLGSLTHTAITKAAGTMVCQPIPLEASSHIADHIMVIMTGFAEQSKASVLHMSSLFHAFILCQLWTVYCETTAAFNSPLSENYAYAHETIMDFWGRVTPGVLQLLSHSKVLAEMVNLHFLSLMEALQECNSTVLAKLFPMWTPILFSYHTQLPGHMQVRLQMCQNWEPADLLEDTAILDSAVLLQWLQRLQFKLGQIEVQSSQATQFYTV